MINKKKKKRRTIEQRKETYLHHEIYSFVFCHNRQKEPISYGYYVIVLYKTNAFIVFQNPCNIRLPRNVKDLIKQFDLVLKVRCRLDDNPEER